MASRLEINLKSVTNEIEKLNKQLDMRSKRVAKAEEKCKELNVTMIMNEFIEMRETLSNEQVWSFIEFSSALDDFSDTCRKLTRADERLSKINAEMNKTKEIEQEIEENKISKIEEFLDKWLADARAYYEEKGKLDKQMDDILACERKRKSLYITYKVYKMVGKIIDAEEIYEANDGNINGYIVGENGRCKVETIIAGGHNIQCRHFRVLVSRI